MLKISLILIFTILPNISFSQNDVSRNPLPNPQPLAITIIPNVRAEKPIEISTFAISSEIYGNLSQTTLTISFYNPNDRNISADFVFPIPANSSLNGYSLDVDGVMVDGVAVEKNKARVTFEKIVRQGIDPGLVEKIDGNIFKTRIFPLVAKQSRTIKIKFSTVLSQNIDSYNYQIPLMTNQLVKDFSMKISASHTKLKPIITNSQFGDLDFSKWQNKFVTEFKRNDFSIEKPLTIEVPKLETNLTIVGKSPNDEYHFSTNPNIKSKLDKHLKPFPQTEIKQIQIVWDASHSRFGANHDLELDFLTEFFNQHKNVTVELYLLRNTIKFVNNFQIKNGQWAKLKLFLSNIDYDGATNLSQLSALAHKNDNDTILFFTDGLHTFSSKETIKTSNSLYIFNSNLAGNKAYSQQLAQENGGQSFQLLKNTNLREIAQLVGKQIPQLLSIDIKEGEVSNLPKLPRTINLNNVEPITAQLLSNNASLTLNYGYEGIIVERVQIEVSRKNALDTNLIELISAQQRLDYLQINSKENKQKILALSQRYNLVSDFTSLIVLESLQQYVEHKIAPPRSMPEMRNDYFVQIKQQKKDRQQHEEDKIQQVLAMWEQRKTWWNKTFPLITKTLANKIPQPETIEEQEELDSVMVSGSRYQGEAALTDATARALALERKNKKTNTSVSASVKINEWDPDTPYLKSLKETNKSARLSKYYQLKKHYFNSPAFYFDSANFFFANEQTDIGLQVLSNIAELNIQDSRLLRTMAMKLKEQNYIDLSIQTYRKVLIDRPEEPQSFRDLALALEQRATKADYQEAIELLYKVITTKWDRFHGIEITVLMELNHLLPIIKTYNIDYQFIDERFITLLDVDLRIVLSWDSDMTDIDLWVIEPSGEKVTYSKTLSTVGGMFHQDFTGGYGPEEYLLKKAPAGDYTIKVHFYGNNSPELTGATNLYLDIFTNYSRESQKKQTLSLRLERASDDYLVGTVKIPNYSENQP